MENKNIKHYLSLIFKGAGMGAANVIPGVSGGTIALITGVFEELIDSIKSFDLKAVKLIFGGKFKEFAAHVNLSFLIAIFFGIAASIISLAKVLEFLFANYPIYVWAYFFGLIVASVYFVGKTVNGWKFPVILSLVVGTAIAISISVLNQAAENEGSVYLILCGVVAICSMILPGLSGSFVLMLMGNYKLVMIDAVSNMRFEILLPVAIGAVVGLVAFSHILSWVYKKYRNQTIAFLTGFILGSLAILWPWQTPMVDEHLSSLKGEDVITGYQKYIPDTFSSEVIFVLVFVVVGFISIWLIEKYAGQIEEKKA